jgi:hypothetical protein
VLRLRKLLQEKLDALKSERQTYEWEKAVSIGVEGNK